MKTRHTWIFTGLFLASCASLFTGYDKKELNDHKEFDRAITVEEFKEETLNEETLNEVEPLDQKNLAESQEFASKEDSKNISPSVDEKKKPIQGERKDLITVVSSSLVKPKEKINKKVSNKKAPKVKAVVADAKKVVPLVETNGEKSPLAAVRAVSLQKPQIGKKEPALEDAEGFVGRRPLVDPIRVGEQTVLSINYFKVEAGRFTLSVKPFKKVNGKKSYHFHYTVKTSSLFSLFYKVDDVSETFVDYDLWRPFSYEIHVKQSKQVRETKSFFDWKTMKGVYLDRKKAPDKPLKKAKREWDILAWSQNVFSVPYYLRSHTLKVGKTIKVRVGHEGKNLLMSAKVLRKEKLKTAVGEFEAFVVRPTFTVDGLFKSTGSNLLWLSADDRKFFLRLESKIKIGTIVGQIEKLKR